MTNNQTELELLQLKLENERLKMENERIQLKLDKNEHFDFNNLWVLVPIIGMLYGLLYQFVLK